MTMSENDVVMALSQKVAMLERRLDKVAKLHLALADKYEHICKEIMLHEANLRDVAERGEGFQADD
jgi:hypothetical protein